MWAAQKNFLDIIAAVLAHGADDQILDNDGQDALKLAEKRNNQDAVKVLKARKEDPDKVTKQIMEEAKKENVKWCLIKSLILLENLGDS